MSDTGPIFVRIFQIPEKYGISTDTIYRAINDNQLKRHKWGRKSFVRREDLERLILGGNMQETSA